jgi:hypothetical protein
MPSFMDGQSSPAASFTAEPTRNLLIVHTPPFQGLSDWLEVKQRIEARAPDIEVRIATNGSPNSVTARWQIQRPSLVFSVSPLFQFKPKGGTVHAGHPMTKLEQLERLASKGFPVPRTAMLSPDLVLDRETWGRYVVLKPLHGKLGQDVRLLRIEDVAARYPELTLDGRRLMVIQPYIEHSEDGYPTEYRVLSLAVSCTAPATAGVRRGGRSRRSRPIRTGSSPRTTRRSAAYGPFATIPRSSRLASRRIRPFRNVRPWRSTSSATPIPEGYVSWRSIRKDCHGTSRR